MTRYLGTLPDGTQLLLTVHDDGAAELATRDRDWETWSPPLALDAVPAEVCS